MTFRELEIALRPDIEAVLFHPALTRLRSGTADRAQWALFARAYARWVAIHPRIVAVVLSQIDTAALSRIIMQTLWEEYGEGVPHRSTWSVYERFSKGLREKDIDQWDIRELAEPANDLLNEVRTASAWFGYGVYGPGLEFMTGDLDQFILEGLEKFDRVQAIDRRFWQRRMTWETNLYLRFMEGLADLSPQETQMQELAKGAASGLRFQLLFWDRLESAFQNLSS